MGTNVPPLSTFRHLDSMALANNHNANWVIPSRLLVGQYPALTDSHESASMQAAIAEAGVTHILCLQTERELTALPDYLVSGPLQGIPRTVFAIKDGGCANDEDLVRVVLVPLLRAITADNVECYYVHCLAGKGRTGTVAALALGSVYGITSTEALNLIQRFFDSRTGPLWRGQHSPENSVQRDQVHRIHNSPKLRPVLLAAAGAGAQQGAELDARSAGGFPW